MARDKRDWSCELGGRIKGKIMEKWAVISSIGVVFLSVWFGWMNYPPPPISPIVYQWKSWGDFYRFDKFNVFYMSKY